MSGVIKPLGISIACNTSNISAYSNAKLVRLTCTAALTVAYTITCKNADGDTNYSVTIVGGQSLILEKAPTDTLQSSDGAGTSVTGVKIAFRN